jgi:hypothetical protein
MLSRIDSFNFPIRISHFACHLRVGLAHLAIVAFLGAAVSTGAAAQDSTAQFKIQGGGQDDSQNKNYAGKSFVQLTPASIVVDPKAHTAAIQFINTGSDTARPTVTVRTGAKESDTAASPSSLTSWIQDLPKQVVLAPHETRTVTLHLNVPAGLHAGDYVGYLVATWAEAAVDLSQLFGTMMQGGGGGNGGSMEIGSAPSVVKLTYHAP